MENNLVPVIQTLYRWRKSILGFTIVAAVVSVVISLLLPVYFQSNTIFYAASPDLGKPEKMFGMTSTDMQYYGSDDDVDRILSLAQSSALQNFLIDSFDLFEYYELERSSTAARSKVQKQLSDDLTIMRNEQDALELSMVHKDPKTAAAIALAARNFIENYVIELGRSSQRRVIDVFQNSIAEKKSEMDRYADTLSYIRNHYGIFDPESQGEILATIIAETESNLQEADARYRSLKSTGLISADTLALVQAEVQGLREKMNSLMSSDQSRVASMVKYNAGLNDYLYFDQLYRTLKSDLAGEQRRLNYYKSAVDASPPGIHLIEEAQVPEKKYSPVRSLIVIGSTLGAFLFSILIVLMIDSFRKFPWNPSQDAA